MSSLNDVQYEFFKQILDVTEGALPDVSFQVYLQAIQGLGNTLETVTDLGTLGATLSMDMESKSRAEFEATTSATGLTISISNPPTTGTVGEAIVLLDTTTLPVSITFPSGSVDEPTITEGKVWELSFKTIDGGTTWRIIGKEWSS